MELVEEKYMVFFVDRRNQAGPVVEETIISESLVGVMHPVEQGH